MIGIKMKVLFTQKFILTILFLLPLVVMGQISVDKVTEKVSRISVAGNTSSIKALLVQDQNDVVLVDAMLGEYAQELSQYLIDEGLNLKFIINTHYHGDHSGGNLHFKDVSKIAHENTYKLITDSAAYGPPASFSSDDMPDLLFSDKMNIFLNATAIEIKYYGPAHTTGDAVVYIPSQNVVCMGDIILDVPYTLPFATDPDGIINALQKVLDLIDGETKIVTGHGSIGNKEDIINLIEIMTKTVNHVKSGKDSSSYPEEWDSWDSEFLSMKNWITMLVNIYSE